ncbi:hypothetical protein [Synechococcus phage metaG-MbCM1]|uniref:Uncharacterized protein n=1 Tax=Synechococcus phage metaG-MbCM1 TaxID=1079999 RepID=H8ZNI4_9CAUD|nr:hypothetical protein [Synechococcus phage metaG-MbCM1]AFD03045.1 hypothetical protein [Synechococcus phage metaG-MbCM1]
MIHLYGLLLAASMTCAEISAKMDRVRNHEQLNPVAKQEIIEVYREHWVTVLGLKCDWDAND